MSFSALFFPELLEQGETVMLHPFYAECQAIPAQERFAPTQALHLLIVVFDRSVDLLCLPRVLAHPEINRLATLFWRLIGNKNIPLIWDQQGLPSFQIIGTVLDQEQRACLLMPYQWLNLVREDPVLQLGGIVNMASQSRDFYLHRFDAHTSERAQAIEAECYHTLEIVHTREQIHWYWNEYQRRIMVQYPQGLASLAPGIWYPTPAYSHPSMLIPGISTRRR